MKGQGVDQQTEKPETPQIVDKPYSLYFKRSSYQKNNGTAFQNILRVFVVDFLAG